MMTGSSAMTAGSWFGGFSQYTYGLITAGVCTGALSVALKGATDLYTGIKNGANTDNLLKGAARLVGGTVVLAASLKAGIRSTAIVTQAIALGTFCAQVAGLGVSDIRKGNYLKGTAEVVFGLTGAGVAAFSGYTELVKPTFSDLDYCPYTNANCGYAKPHPSTTRSITIGSIYEDNGNKQVKEIATLVDETHKEYAEKWGLTHTPVVTTRADLQGRCTDPRTAGPADCSPYWPKIPAMINWTDSHVGNGKNEVFMMIDYDGPIGNMQVDPHLMAEKWMKDGASVVVTRDSADWAHWNFPGKYVPSEYNMNGGFWVIDNSPKSKDFLERVWKWRDTVHDLTNPNCITKGMCKNQDCLHEQEGTVAQLLEDSSLYLRGVVNIIPQRDPETGVGFNTAHRTGCFVRHQAGFAKWPYGFFGGDRPGTQWQPGDFMAQPNGVPPVGQEGPEVVNADGNCMMDPTTPVTDIRIKRIKEMIDHTKR
jgi:hypothetical protein